MDSNWFWSTDGQKWHKKEKSLRNILFRSAGFLLRAWGFFCCLCFLHVGLQGKTYCYFWFKKYAYFLPLHNCSIICHQFPIPDPHWNQCGSGKKGTDRNEWIASNPVLVVPRLKQVDHVKNEKNILKARRGSSNRGGACCQRLAIFIGRFG